MYYLSFANSAKMILRYIKGTTSYELFNLSTDGFQLVRYTNSDWAGDLDEQKSTSCYVFFTGNTIFS